MFATKHSLSGISEKLAHTHREVIFAVSTKKEEQKQLLMVV